MRLQDVELLNMNPTVTDVIVRWTPDGTDRIDQFRCSVFWDGRTYIVNADYSTEREQGFASYEAVEFDAESVPFQSFISAIDWAVAQYGIGHDEPPSARSWHLKGFERLRQRIAARKQGRLS